LRQVADASKDPVGWLYRPSTALRVDNDMFQGTPLPPEEPTANNPPNGAVIDYFLKSGANKISLEIYDSKQELVRSFSSDDPKELKHPPVAIAERWLAKAEALEPASGMHRFLWNLAWGDSVGKSVEQSTEGLRPCADPGPCQESTRFVSQWMEGAGLSP
jgi:hypothetical protein